MNKALSRTLLVLGCSAFCITFLSGCQKTFTFDVYGTIKGCGDGSLLAGVRVEFVSDGLVYRRPSATLTGPDGSFSFQFGVSDVEFSPNHLPKWSLRLAKEGYLDEVVNISLRKVPVSGESWQIVAAAYMRPK